MKPATALIAYDLTRQAADVAQATAVAWLVAASTGSALAVAGIWTVNLLPWLGLPLFGDLADRLPRRRLVWTAQIAVLLAAVATAAAARGRLPLSLAFAWTAVYATLTALARPAIKGLIREVSHEAATLVARLTAWEYLVLGLGQFLAAAVLVSGSPSLAFGLMAGLLALGLPALARTGTAEPAPEPAPPWRPVLAQLAGPRFRGLFFLTVVCGACAFTLRVLAPLLVLRDLGGGVLAFAGLGAAYSLGAALGAAWNHGRPAAGWLVAAAAVLAAGTTGSLVLALIAFVAIGVASGHQDAANSARVAAELPPGAQSRGMAVASLIWRVPNLLAGAVAGLAASGGLGALSVALAAVMLLTGSVASASARWELGPARRPR